MPSQRDRLWALGVTTASDANRAYGGAAYSRGADLIQSYARGHLMWPQHRLPAGSNMLWPHNTLSALARRYGSIIRSANKASQRRVMVPKRYRICG